MRESSLSSLSAILSLLGLVVASVALLGGCSTPGLGKGFDSADPSQQISATERAVRENDQDAIPHLIEGLDSDDPAVRFVSIHALEELTGKTYGYKHFAPPREREAAIDRWVEAVNNQEIGVTSAPGD